MRIKLIDTDGQTVCDTFQADRIPGMGEIINQGEHRYKVVDGPMNDLPTPTMGTGQVMITILKVAKLPQAQSNAARGVRTLNG